jgi:hypothetical protein
MTEKETLEKIAEALTQLDEERTVLTEKLAVENKALVVVEKLYKKGNLTGQEIFSKLAELSKKSFHELEVLEQALELSKVAGFSFGSVSDTIDPESLVNPEEKFTLFLTEDN